MAFTKKIFHYFSKNVNFVLTTAHLASSLKSYGIGVKFET